MNNIIESKDIDIRELSTKPRDVENIDLYRDFKANLDINNISEPIEQTNIQKYWDYFFFYKNGKALFSVKSEKTFLTFLNEFYNYKETTEKQILIDLNNLKLSIYAWDPNIVWQKEQNQIDRLERILDIPTLQQAVERLEWTLEDQLKDTNWQWIRFNFKWIKNTPEERKLRKQYQNQINKRLKEVKKIERDLEKIEKWETDFEIVNEYRGNNKLEFLSKKIDNLTTEVLDIDDALIALSYWDLPNTPYFDYKIRGRRDAQKLANSMSKYNTELIKITSLTQVSAGERLRQEDLTALQDYLNWVIDGRINPAIQAFTPEQERAYKYLQTVDPSLKSTFGTLPASWKISDKNVWNINTWVTAGTVNANTTGNINNPWWGVGGNNLPENQQAKSEYKDRNEALANWWLYWLLDHTTKWFQDQSPRAQQFYRGFGNVAIAAWTLFVGVKVLKSLWRIVTGKADGSKNERAWVLWTAWVLLATAGRPQDLFRGGYPSEMLSNFFNRVGLGKKNNSLETTPQAVVAAMALFNGKNYGQIRDMLTQENWKIKIDANKYDQMVSELNTIITSNATAEQKERAKLQLQFLQTVGKEDKNGFVHHALTSVGLTWEELSNPENKDKSFDKDISKVMERIVLINQKMWTANYTATNPEVDASIKSYISSWTPSLEDLEAMGAFEKAEKIPAEEQTRLKTMVEGLGVTDASKKEQILKWLYQFYIDRPTDEATKKQLKIEKIENDLGSINFTTYGQKTRINIDNKTISWLDSTFFSSTKELFKAANLTNRIKEITKIQKDIPENPFRPTSWWIKFNNSEWFEVRKIDDKVISDEGLQKVSPTLSNKKDQYVAYLNDRWKNKEKPDYTPDAAIVTAAAAATTIIDNQENLGSWSGETPEQKAEKEKKEIETFKTNLSAAITALEPKLTNSWIDSSKKAELENKLKVIKENKWLGTKEQLQTAIVEVGKIEEELNKLEKEKIENEEKEKENEEKRKEKIDKKFLEAIKNNVLEKWKKYWVTLTTLTDYTNPNMWVVIKKNNSNAIWFNININDIIDQKDKGFEVNENRLKIVLEKWYEEESKRRKEIKNLNELWSNVLSAIKESTFTIDQLFPEEKDNIRYLAYFNKFDKKTLEFDPVDTKILPSNLSEILVTFDDSWGNESYNENISIKLSDIKKTNENKLDEIKFKNKIKEIVAKIVEENF